MAERELEAIEKLSPEKIVLSPGPGRPKDHPFMFEVIKHFSGKLPILGICLGMQALNEFFGGSIKQDIKPTHGKTSQVFHDESNKLFAGVSSPFVAARYHSLVLDKISQDFNKTAWTKLGIPMAFQHRVLPLFGLQFHPESFLTPDGNKIMQNFYYATTKD